MLKHVTRNLGLHAMSYRRPIGVYWWPGFLCIVAVWSFLVSSHVPEVRGQQVNCGVNLIIDGKKASIEDGKGVEILTTTVETPTRFPVVMEVGGAQSGTVRLEGSLPDGMTLYTAASGGSVVTLPETWTLPTTLPTYYIQAVEPTDEVTLTLTLGDARDEAKVYASCSCTTCQAGDAQGANTSLSFRLSLGKSDYGDDAGYLSIYSPYPNSDLATPAALEATVQSGVTVTRNGTTDDIELVEADQVQVEVNVVSGTKYELVIKDYANPTPNTLKTITVESPGGDVNKLYITEDGGTNKVWQFEWSTVSMSWTMSEGAHDGQNPPTTTIVSKTERKEETVSATVHNETITVKDAADNLVRQTQEQYKIYPWGEELIARIRDPAGAALTETWEYYTDTADTDNYGRLKLYTNDAGYWERYEYNSDGEMSKKIAQYENEVYQDTNLTTLEADNIVTAYTWATDSYTYAPSQSKDGELETITVNDRGTPVSKRYRMEWSGTVNKSNTTCTEVWDIEGASAAGSWDDSTNLVTKTWRIAPGNSYAHRVKLTLSPDGTMTIYTYATNGLTIAQQGFPNDPTASNPWIIYGTTNVTQVNDAGYPKYIYTLKTENGTNWFGVSLQKTESTDFDFYGRPEAVDYYFGEEAQDEFTTPGSGTASYSTATSYACCGVESYTDRNGITTRYEYDELGRVIETTREFEDSGSNTTVFAATQQVYDAAGSVKESKRSIVLNPSPTNGAHWETVQTTTYDLAGRIVSIKDANNKYDFYAYHGATVNGVVYDETRVYPHDKDAGPIQVTWTDSHGRTAREFTATTVTDWNGSHPSGYMELSQEFSRTTYVYDWADRQIETWTYFNGLATLGITSTGTENTNYYKATSEYDDLGRIYRHTDEMGSITEIAYDAQGRVKELSQGTSSGMTVVSKSYYDLNYDRTGTDFRPYITRTERIKPIDTLAGTSADYTATDFTRLNQQSGTTSWTKPAVGPWTKQITDDQGLVKYAEQYVNGSEASTSLLAKTENIYDSGTGYLTEMRMYEVGASGSVGSYLKTTYAYDDAGRQVKVEQSGGGYTKTEYDARGRVERTVTASAEGATSDPVGSDGLVDFTSDVVLTETVPTYDDVDNVIQVTSYEREHDATATGLLSDSASSARVTYQATWYDDAHRPTYAADYGTYGGSTFNRPGTPPEPNGSSTVTITKTTYDAAGRVEKTTDNIGIVTKTFYDDMGRQTYIAENWDNFAASTESGTGDNTDTSKDRVTKFAYNAASQVTHQIAMDPDGDGSLTDNQTTTYTYGGDNGTDSPVRRKDLLIKIAYPDSTGDSDTVKMTYMADGSLASRTDQRAVELIYEYDNAGRRTSQTVDSGTVAGDQLVEYGYDSLSRLEYVTTYDAKTSGDVTSQVQYVYNGLGQLIYEYQQHGDEVEDTTPPLSPRIAYAYEPAVSGIYTKGGRLDTVTYPNGRTITRTYDGHDGTGSSIDDAIARSNGIDSVVEYTYLGSGRMVRKDYPTPEVYLDYWGGTSGTYDGLDDFGRITAQRWIDYSGTPTDVFHVKHGYDAAGNRRYADRQVYPSYSQYYLYDELHRLEDYQAGKMSYSGSDPTGIASYWKLNSRGYTLDQLGNQLGVDTPEATDYYTNEIEPGEANEYVARNVKANTARLPLSDDPFSVDTSANWISAADEESVSTSDEFAIDDVPSDWFTVNAVSADTFDGHTEAEARIIVLLGDDIGPSHIETRVSISATGYTTIAGIVFGYKSPNDYWVKSVDVANERYATFHIVNGVATLIASEEEAIEAGGTYTISLSGRRYSDATSPSIGLTSGFPSGRVGLMSNSDDTSFDYFKVYPNETSTDLAGRWVNFSRSDGSDGNAITSAGRLKLYRPVSSLEELPILLDGVRVDQFEATFSVRTPTLFGRFEFVFNANDQADHDSVILRHTAALPYGYEVDDGGTRQLVSASTQANGPAAISTDVVWYRAKYDGSSVTVKRLIDNSGTPSEGDWSGATTVFESSNFEMTGGMIGFKGYQYSSVLIDDLTLKAYRDTTGNGTPDTWVTEHEDGFDVSSGYADLEPEYDAAGNLTYDGRHAFAYDAWNRLVAVTKAYPTPGTTGYDEGSTVATMQYDGLGRRTVKDIRNSADMDTTHHYYYDSQSVVQTDNGSNQMIKQYVWGLRYIDELCQVALNIDPANAADQTYPENIAERFYYALQDANYNVLGIVNHAGRIIERYEYTPYGQRTVYSHGDILADINGDGFVGLSDLNAVISTYWNQSSDAAQVADLNGDGYVDGDDQAIVTPGAWNKSAPGNDPLVTYPILQSARHLKYVGAGSDPGTALCEVGHQGLFHDEEFGSQGGLIHNRARTLHPRLGRFMQRDPFRGLNAGGGYQDGMNLVAYHPAMISTFDPDGLKAWTEPTARQEVSQEIQRFRSLGYNFAADLMQHFLDKKGPAGYIPTGRNIEEVKKHARAKIISKIREELTPTHIDPYYDDDAIRSAWFELGDSQTINISHPGPGSGVPSNIRWWYVGSDKNMLYAYGGADFNASGTAKITSVKVEEVYMSDRVSEGPKHYYFSGEFDVRLADKYIFDSSALKAWASRNWSEPYDAAFYLETACKYAPFDHQVSFKLVVDNAFAK